MPKEKISGMTPAPGSEILAADKFMISRETSPGVWETFSVTQAWIEAFVSGGLAAEMTAYTPSVAPATGAFSTAATVPVASYTKIGKLVFFTLQFTLGTVGTGAGALEVSLPSTAAFPSTQLVEEYATVGRVDRGNISAGSPVISIRQINGTTVIADGAGFRFTGYYLEA